MAVHLIRHHIGIEKFVSTQRPDRTDATINRDSLSQGELVNVNLVLNAQAWINISRKRLCFCASKETREVWSLALDELEKIDPELRVVCVKECLYRGFCPETKPCGYTNTATFINLLMKYRCGGIYGRQETQVANRVQSEESSVQVGESTSEEQRKTSENSSKTRSKTASKKRRTRRAPRKGTGKNEAQ